MALLLNIPLDDTDEATLVRFTDERNNLPGAPSEPLTPNNVAARHVRFWLRAQAAEYRALGQAPKADEAYRKATPELQARFDALIAEVEATVVDEAPEPVRAPPRKTKRPAARKKKRSKR
jgi:hypothetical protein